MAELVGLVGKKQVGKDTFAGALADRGWSRVAFADPVKEGLYALNPRVDGSRLRDLVDDIGWDQAKILVPEVRRLLQEYGTGIRAYDSEFWIRAAMKKVAEARFEGKNVIVTDVRFENEARAIREAGGKLIRVTRDGGAQDDHISEVELDDYEVDLSFSNSGTLERLRALAPEVVAQALGIDYETLFA